MGHCPLCRGAVAPQLLRLTTELQAPIRRLVQRQHPDWSPADGICPDCALRYARRHAAQRSDEPLHTQTFPNTTFPYYHPAEERILALSERLPDYPTATGTGVTIAFLDSGYYPHPDLLDGDRLVDLTHSNAEVGRTRRLLEQQPLRIRQYVNLMEGVEHTGLDAASLWSDAANSWHGQMTSAVAAGNGLLSGGLYRGFAPEADLLLIKIGRTNGGIPEAEIERGLRWLLRHDRWERHGVRVVNVSVGGDHPQDWRENEVCLAAEELAHRGVLVVVAAGNANRPDLLAPAQAPSVLTVGGVDDGNRRWCAHDPQDVARLQIYHHNWGEVFIDAGRIAKPELLALARWVPAPILPVSPIFREMWVLGQAWDLLDRGEIEAVRRLLWQWQSVLELTPAIHRADEETLRRALRLLSNPHKFTHAHYQHVDGSSVAAPQVAAVAAQMFQVNPSLTAHQAKALLEQSALPLPHLPAERTGAGLLQPAVAVALALRAAGGPLAGYPLSGTVLDRSGLRDLAIPVKVATNQAYAAEHSVAALPASQQLCEVPSELVPCYFGIRAPSARSVSLIGTFNGWQPDQLPLFKANNGWWHAALCLPPGVHFYRYWVTDGDTETARWISDPENTVRTESGFLSPHSQIDVRT